MSIIGDFICSAGRPRFFGGEKTEASFVWKSRHPRVETSPFRGERGKDRNCALCRFWDAGDDEAGHRFEDRRLKSAEARNRGKLGAPSVPRALWGFSRGVRLGEVGQSARPNCFASQDECG